ncbi:TPA: AsmA family protein [Klebsiella pneumoniae]|nr:AsmA family protein [Klebsiella pneumoniae]
MSRTRKTLVIITGTILLLIVLFFIVLATFDWNRLKPTINQKVSAELNRPFAIRGDLGVVWERQPDERGWRSWIPWPHVHAEDIVLGNPPAIPQVTMIQLRGSGNSVAALLGNSNGNLKLLMNDGLISRNLMEILGLNVGNYLIGQIFGDEEVRVNCAAANIDVTNGVARPQIFAFDTENALINVTGTASFASEQLDLTIDPESKGFRVITLRSPLYVRGTFKSPQAGVKAGPLIVRGAVAAALATLVTPAAALLALISPAEGDSNQCRTILSQMKK